jgi:hypothetical protein
VPSPLPESPLGTGCERLTRLIYSESQYNVNTGKVRYNAFIPPKKSPNELSVIAVHGLDEPEVWEHGTMADAARTDGKRYLARTDRPGALVLAVGLTVHRNDDPYPRHTNLLNWPAETEVKERLRIAVDLAREALPVKRPI